MKDKRKEMEETKITGFFDNGTEFKGDLKFKGSFRIDGYFQGKIESDSMLIIGDKGKVEAEVYVGFVIINGEFKGNIRAVEKVEINSNGRVTGTIITPKLVVEEGAYLEANCQTSEQVALPGVEQKEKSGK